MSISKEILIQKIGQYFESSILSSGAFNTGPIHLKNEFIKGILENKNSYEVVEYIKEFSPVSQPKILDIGCGLGGVLLACQESNLEAWGVEIDRQAADIAKLRIDNPERIIIGDALNLPFSNCSFDVVVSKMVIEHISDPKTYLEEAIRVLKPNGIFILFAPNYLFPWEGHYRMFWIPYLFPYSKNLFKIYLKLRGRKTKFIDFVNTKITPSYLKNLLKNLPVTYINLSVERMVKRFKLPIWFSIFIKLTQLYHPIILIIRKKN